ncbi:recombinase family protein [Nitrobacter sp.]|uniref:recombinase family protein n=1 Tax=Nitrobacter sp. TaxID=29420 RepID=UPI0029CAC594|nr:recombinase family protein [Nitrobacter sp.]
MTARAPAKTVRCAIYTRVSTDQGLEQDFNSLDAQYDAASAYIRSQAHAGWTLLRAKYDDGGFSGGNTDRPALQQLLTDVRSGKLDVIVVYKVDRLTRSLADFAKLVELFDANGVSFVSVTQQFNTTTSIGRLTLNVLLSFAQFEREVTSERIRDKIAASKRKGLWVGGMVPLGYDSHDRKITVNEAEADRVRDIFRNYLKLGSLNALMVDLRKRGVLTKVRRLRTGVAVGGIPFTRGPLAHLLRNRFYIGEVAFKGEILPGEQTPIMDRRLFDAVQAKLDQQIANHKTARSRSGALLTGKIFDDRGQRMTPTHSTKGAVRYRYYTSSALIQGQADKAGSVSRVSGPEIENVIIAAVRKHFSLPPNIEATAVIQNHVLRIEVHLSKLVVQVTGSPTSIAIAKRKNTPTQIEVPWQRLPTTRRREILVPPSATANRTPRPIRSENRALLVASIARGRRWLNELTTDRGATTATIAAREHCSERKVNMTISLAFLAPDLVHAAIDGRLPHGMGVAKLSELPSSWSQQRTAAISTERRRRPAPASRVRYASASRRAEAPTD